MTNLREKSFDRHWLAGSTTFGPIRTALLVLVGFAIMAISILFNDFGLLHFEWWSNYVTFHLGPETIWKKIFDSRTLDQGVYAGRELSYLIDQFDMQVLVISVKGGLPLFVSATHILLCVCIGVWLARFASQELGLGSLVGIALALLFWTTPYVYLHFLMRTAKGLTALGAVMVALEIFRAFNLSKSEPKQGLRWPQGAVIAGGAFVMSFADRQGFYLLLTALALTGIDWLFSQRRVVRDIFLLLGLVLVVELGYFFWGAPALTRIFWGYDPDFSFNRLQLGSLWTEPGVVVKQSWEVWIGTIGRTLGSIPDWSVVLIVAGLIGLLARRDILARVWRRHLPVSVVMLAFFLASWVMYALMILRHPPLLWPDVQLIYYWLPLAALLLLGLSLAVSGLLKEGAGPRIVIAICLLTLTLSNVRQLPGMRQQLVSGHLAESARVSWLMREGLRYPHGEDGEFPPEITAIPAFLTLLAYAPSPEGAAARGEDFPPGEFYRRTRGPSSPVRFIAEFGGNLDCRFLRMSGRFFTIGGERSLIGADEGRAEMRLNVPVNRLRGEVVVRRAQPDSDEELAVNFTVHAQPKARKEPRYERWQAEVRLPPGADEVLVPYSIDGSGLPTTFTMEVAASSAGKVLAGWRWPEVTDVGRDSSSPSWITAQGPAPVRLDEAALGALLPEHWRPVEAWMRKGRVQSGGIELAEGGEIWLKVDGIVSRFVGTAQASPGDHGGRLPSVWGLWYKAGRLEIYQPPQIQANSDTARSFQAWCAESGGWLVIALDSDATASPLVVRVTDIRQEN